MKQSPHLNRIRRNLAPGVITIQGFMGDDSRDLVQILDEDDANVKRMGLTHEMIAAKMRELTEAGKRGLGDFIEVPPCFSVRVDTVRGKLRCPFEDPGLIEKVNTTVRNLNFDEEITYTNMNTHCVEKHGFYQGKGSFFRIDPEKIARILEVK